MSAKLNRRILLKARPQGAQTPANFAQDSAPLPTPAAGQVLLRNL